MDYLWSKITNEGKTCHTAGDFNIDLLEFECHLPNSEYIDCILSHGFVPVTNIPACITDFSATPVDNIITNSNLYSSMSDVVCTDLSDHFSVDVFYCLVKWLCADKFYYKRNYTQHAIATFTENLQNNTWKVHTVSECTDPNVAYDHFIDSFASIFDSSFPLVKVETNN
jgi:hypothetical protein